MRISGTNFVVGRTQRKGDIPDVRIYTSPTGLSMIEIARDAKDLSPRSYTIDRRLEGGPWSRLLQVNSFSEADVPDNISEVRADVIFEEIPNFWGITPLKSWGLPAGMESPWIEPLEMVGNELLLPEGARWVSGDAPINQERDNYFSNGRYGVEISGSHVDITNKVTGESLANLQTNTRGVTWTEGVAGAVSFFGGSVHIEPAKPPILLGTFSFNREPVYVRPGVYEYGRAYLITSVPVSSAGRLYTGALAIVDDPFPERWVPRVFCRSYVTLISPSYVPPLVEEEPQRVGVRVEYVENDFPGIEPKVVTPYADKTGVFNSWEIETGRVILSPRNRPYDLLIPFDENLEDWGGNSVWTPGEFFPTLDRVGEAHASLATEIPYETSSLPPIYEGAVFLRWKESNNFFVFTSSWADIVYKNGRVFFDNRTGQGLTGISRLIDVSGSWNDLKIEWGTNYLTVNDVEALTEPRTWQDVLLGDDDTAPEFTWGQIANIPPDEWTPDPDLPLDVKQWEEKEPTWVTGNPEWEDEPPDVDYSASVKTWGEVMFVPYGE
jgi:hypothetical protein